MQELRTQVTGMPADIALHPPKGKILVEFVRVDWTLGIAYYRYAGVEDTHAEEDEPGYHGEGELADYDPNTGRSSWDDWGKD